MNVTVEISKSNIQQYADKLSTDSVRSVTTYYTFLCPWCSCFIEVDHYQLNCYIFRHGFINGKQVSQHILDSEASSLTQNTAFIGCGKQFFFDGTYVVRLSDEKILTDVPFV